MQRPYRDQYQLLGKTIEGRFFIEELIDEGGFGWVYRGYDEVLKGPVAIKVLQPNSFTRKSDKYLKAYNRFKKEAQLLKRMRSPTTVEIISVGEYEDEGGFFVYMIMEFLDGVTLNAYVNRINILSARDMLHVFEQILDSLNDAHQQQLIHRDLKPDNIMVLGGKKNKSGKLSVKLLDFGLFKAMDEEHELANEKTDGLNMTLTYGAPEQMMDPTAVGPHTDLYSLGMVAYYCLCGHNPLGRASSEAEKLRIARSLIDGPDIQLATSYKPGGLKPTPLTAIINKMLIKNFDVSAGPVRYLSCDEVYEDLQPFIVNPSLLQADRMHGDSKDLPGFGTIKYNVAILGKGIHAADHNTVQLPDTFFESLKTGEIEEAPTQKLDIPTEQIPSFQKATDVTAKESVIASAVLNEPKVPIEPVAPTVAPPVPVEAPQVIAGKSKQGSSSKWIGVVVLVLLCAVVAVVAVQSMGNEPQMEVKPVGATTLKPVVKKQEKKEIKTDTKVFNEEAKLKANTGGVLAASGMKYRAQAVILGMKEKTSSKRKPSGFKRPKKVKTTKTSAVPGRVVKKKPEDDGIRELIVETE